MHADSTRTRKKGIEKRSQGILVREVRPDQQGFLLKEVVKLEPPVIPSLLYSSKAFDQSGTYKNRLAKLLRESQGITAHEGHYFSFLLQSTLDRKGAHQEERTTPNESLLSFTKMKNKNHEATTLFLLSSNTYERKALFSVTASRQHAWGSCRNCSQEIPSHMQSKNLMVRAYVQERQ